MIFIDRTMLGASINHVIDKSKGGNGYSDTYKRKEDKPRKRYNGDIDTRTDVQRAMQAWARV